MLIQQVNEENYLEEIEKGQLEVQKKFDRWNQLGKLKDTLSRDEFNTKAAWLLRDPTVWAYAFLKDDEGRRLAPYYFQDSIMNDSHRFIHVTAANQIGKTWALCIKCLHHALHVQNARVLLISKTEKQAKRILDEMKWMLRRSDINFKDMTDEVDNRFELHLKSPNKGISTINVFAPTGSFLGFPGTFIGLDETGFWELDGDLDPISFYQQVIEPRTSTTRLRKHEFLTMGQIISISNPNGQNGLAWWLRNNKNWHQYIYNFLAKPQNTKEFYEEKKKEIPKIIFASTYAAEYLSGSGGFITLDQYSRFASYLRPLAIPPKSLLFMGADFASESPKTKDTDHTAMYGVVQVKNKDYPQHPRVGVVYANSWPPGTKKTVIYNEISRIQALPGVRIAKFAYDKVGVGDSVKGDLIGRGIFNEIQIEPLTYSLPNKSDVYLNFQNLFQQDMIEGTEIPAFKEQVLALRVEQPVGSVHIKVHHKTEGVKDDHPDALANACYVAKVLSGFPVSLTIVGEAKDPIKDRPKKSELTWCTGCNDEYYWSKEGISACEECTLKSRLKRKVYI